MLTFTIIIALLFSSKTIEGHFLWQQTFQQQEDDDEMITVFTFGETPSIDNVDEVMSKSMAYEKDLSVYMNSVIGDEDEIKLSTEVMDNNKYIEATLPSNITRDKDNQPTSYVLESFCNWGLRPNEENKAGLPHLLQYYTSASYLHKEDDLLNLIEKSKNTFLFVLLRNNHKSGYLHQPLCKNYDPSTHYCVQAIVKYDGSPLEDYTKVAFFNGDDGELITEGIRTDINGMAFQAVPKTMTRIFGRVNFDYDTPGETKSGESYQKVVNWATAFLELSTTTAVSPFNSKVEEENVSPPNNTNKEKEESNSQSKEKMDESNTNNNNNNSESTTTSLSSTTSSSNDIGNNSTGSMSNALMSFIGSFFGGFLAASVYKILSKQKLQQQQQQQQQQQRYHDVTTTNTTEDFSLEMRNQEGEVC